MRWLRTLRADFSPYEFGAAQVVLSTVIFAAAFVAMWSQPARAPGVFATFAIFLLLVLQLDRLTACPGCGKRATMRLLSRRKPNGVRLFQMRRSWPERTCGECGHDLTARGVQP